MPNATHDNATSLTDVSLSLGQLVRQLAPSCMGLAASRIAYLTQSFGSYRGTDVGLLTDGTLLIAIVLLIAPLLVLQRPSVHLKKRTLWSMTRVCFAGQALLLALYAALIAFDVPGPGYVLSVLAALCFAGSSFHWIRRARGADADVAAVFVLVALAVSEVFLYLFALTPEWLGCVLAALLALGQFPCLRAARALPLPAELRLSGRADGMFGGAVRTSITSRRFLATSALGLTVMGVAIGILRGYPFGDVIEFDPVTRIAYALLTIGVCLVLCRRVARPTGQSPMTVSIWVVMQLLGAVALIAYAALPGHLAVGAVFTTTLNALLVAFMWYATISFVSCGPNDPYYYCIGGWTAFLLPRAIVRTVCIVFVTSEAAISVTVAIVSLLLLLCAQAVFLQLYGMRDTSEPQPASLGKPLDHLLGLSTMLTPAEVRDAAVHQQIDEIRERYQLSDREAEVLALYAQGETQNKIAETLGITINTAHAHIKHIYSKCDLHSRQELLDFVRDYERL